MLKNMNLTFHHTITPKRSNGAISRRIPPQLLTKSQTLLPQWKVEDIQTGTVYVIDHIQVSQATQRVMVYAREEKTRKPVCLDHRKIRKIHLIDVVRAEMAKKEKEQ